jgi:lipid A 4'-phosphatase
MKQLLLRYADILLACSLAMVFIVWPQLDLQLAASFYQPDKGFPAGQALWIQPIYIVIGKLWVLAFVLLFLLLLSFLPAFRKRWAPRRTMMVYLLSVLLIGPGLITNTLLKEHWGRARPVHLTQFGGESQFTPALQPSNQCHHNCAFVSGHTAAAFYPIAGFWLTRRRRWLVGGTALGLLVGYTRMAMGAHFLSDVLFAGIVVYFTCRLLAYVFRLQGSSGGPLVGLGGMQSTGKLQH